MGTNNNTQDLSTEVVKKRRKVTVEDPDATLTEHLEDLRIVLIKSAIVVIVWFLIIFSTVGFWFPVVSKDAEIVVLGPFEVIRFYIKTAGSISIGLSIPFICWFLFQFMRPGLVEKETNFIRATFPIMLILFIVGTLFGYFIVHTISYFFLIEMGQRNFDVLVTADEYMSFLLFTTIPIGLIFQLPIVILFLNHIELLDSKIMIKGRKYAYFGLLVIVALIMPPDLFTHIVTTLPMLLLYEVSIYLVKRNERKKKLKETREQKEAEAK